MHGTVTRKGLGPRPVHLSKLWNVLVRDFVRERFHKMSPGDVERTFINAGDSDTKIEEADHSDRSEPRQSCLGPWEM